MINTEIMLLDIWYELLIPRSASSYEEILDSLSDEEIVALYDLIQTY